nr:TniQ family protein [uncultured Caldimonas sp.]
MHIPALLPDELLGGYLQRIATLNALDDGAAVLKRLLQAPNRARGRTACPTPVELVATASQVSKALLIRGHSLFPLRRLVTRGTAPVAYGAARSRALERRDLDRLLEPGSKRCPECAREDVLFWGFAYDRRSAQLPGVDWCAKHGVRLEQAWTPKAMAAEVSPADITQAERRYIDIFGGLMDLSEGVPMTHACLRLRERTRQLGLRQRSDQKGPGLDDLARVVMPRGWLRRHHPTQAGLQRGGTLDQVCAYRPVPFTADVYVLALTVLYDSAEEALMNFLRPLSAAESQRAAGILERRAAGQRRNGSIQGKGSIAAVAPRVEPQQSGDNGDRGHQHNAEQTGAAG